MTSQTTLKEDVYSKITNKIIADLERGELTWRKPWNPDNLIGKINRPLRWNNVPYTGVNIIMLWAEAADRGYQTPYWMTFKQAAELKGHVKKGEKATQVVFADSFTVVDKDQNGEEKKQNIPFLKSYAVFNAAQIDGLPEPYYNVPEFKPTNEETRILELEKFFAATKAEITHGGNQAYYSVTQDKVQMPPFECFYSALNYYSCLSHEMVHWTRHPKRLDRDFGRKHFGDEGYAKEELVAELGSCFLSSDLGLEPESHEGHAAYIQSWLTVLKNDKKFIVNAASHAQRATEYILNLCKP